MPSRAVTIGAGIVAVAVLAGGGAAWGTGVAGGDDGPLTGSTLDRAVSSALAHTGGGKVVETEAGDGRAAYSVEVRLEDGRVVEVDLDAAFAVISSAADDDSAGDRADED
jgi:hypothetical protein